MKINRQTIIYSTNTDCGSGGSTADMWVIPVPYKCRVTMVMAMVDNAASSTHATSWVITWDRRILAGSDVGRVEAFATLTRPATSVVNHVVYERPTTLVIVEPGDEIVAELKTLDGTATQNVKLAIELEYIPENPANITDMVAA